MLHRIEVYTRDGFPDAQGKSLTHDAHDLGLHSVENIRTADIYWIEGNITRGNLEELAEELLADPIVQYYRIDGYRKGIVSPGIHAIEVTYHSGVTDPVAETALKAIKDLGVVGVRAVKTARLYLITGELSTSELELLCQRLLLNPIIQHVVETPPETLLVSPRYEFTLKQVELVNLPKEGLTHLAREFGFNDEEIRVIKDHFTHLGRNPTDIEMETLAQTWSEHCVHKTFKAHINYNGHIYNNLLKETIMRATEELGCPWCLSVFKDNSGVIAFDDETAVCFKVETHNHPSAIEPYGGAATGIGGVVRDIMGTGLSARPIANTDVFCFGPPDLSYEELPPRVLHPKRVFKGVRAGVADYGNRLGIPTLNGAILFDKAYTYNPLVFCGTVGIMPREAAQLGSQQPGDLVVLVGGRTGRDGIRGVTFASAGLTSDSTQMAQSSVQIGNPIEEKKIIDGLQIAREERLFRRITDCGGGGLSSAVGEMAAETGVKVYLDQVPLKYSGLSYSEIWISESQERMILAVPREHFARLHEVFAAAGNEATPIGEFTADRHLRIFYQGHTVADLDMDFLHNGRPQLNLEASWHPAKWDEPELKKPPDPADTLMKLLSSWNICSREWVIRQYDHEVQGSSVLKPLVGAANDGPGDGAVIRPRLGSQRAVIIANGINCYGCIDPYWMAASAIDEALRQIIAVGGSLSEVALLDNFCWGNVRDPEGLGALARACQACHDMAISYGTPFISGKDSLNNEFEVDGKAISIPPTLLISAIGVLEDAHLVISMDLKRPGDLLYIIGTTRNELGGSEYYRLLGYVGNNVPQVDPLKAKEDMIKLSHASQSGLVEACHDLSDGGLGVALAEMAIAGRLGADLHLSRVPLGEPITGDDLILFSESNTRFLVEVAPQNQARFETVMAGTTLGLVGKVHDGENITIYSRHEDKLLTLGLEELRKAWQEPLQW